jgi:hypothetical protein
MTTRTKTARSTLKLETLEERQVLSAASAAMHAVVDSSGNSAVFYINPQNQAFYEKDAYHGTPRQLSGPNTVQEFSAGLDAQGRADAYVLDGAGSLYQWSESRGWVDLIDQTTITEFCAVKGGRMYAETNDGSLLGYDGVGGSGFLEGWSVLGDAGTVQHIDAVTDAFGQDAVFAIRGDGTFQELQLYNNNSQSVWQPLSGSYSINAGFSAGVGLNGHADAYGVGTADGGFWKYDTDTPYQTIHWTRLADPGLVSQFSATTNGQCWFIATDGTLKKFNSSNVRQDVYNGGYFTQISAAASNDVFVMNWDSTLWERKAQGAWSQIA